MAFLVLILIKFVLLLSIKYYSHKRVKILKSYFYDFNFETNVDYVKFLYLFKIELFKDLSKKRFSVCCKTLTAELKFGDLLLELFNTSCLLMFGLLFSFPKFKVEGRSNIDTTESTLK